MPWTLYRYMTTEMVKLLVLCTAVLVIVVDFAVAIKPLSDGDLGPTALLRYMYYMTPLILGFVVPFAASFAATMVFNRLSNDNEVLACRASGMSYPVIMLPVMLLGLVLLGGLYYMSNFIVPSFYRNAKEVLQADIAKLVVARIGRGESVRMQNQWVLFADAAAESSEVPTVPGSTVQPSQLLILQGAAMGRIGPDNRLRSDSTAERADVFIWNIDGETWLTAKLRNVTHFDPEAGQMRVSLESPDTPAIRLDTRLNEQPMFLSLTDLREISDNPEKYRPVREKKRALSEELGSLLILESLTRAMERDTQSKGVELLGPAGDRYRIYSPAVRLDKGVIVLRAQPGSSLEDPLIPTGQKPGLVRVDRVSSGVVIRRIEAISGVITLEPGGPEVEPRIRIKLIESREYDTRVTGLGTEHASVDLPRSRWPEAVVGPLNDLSIAELMTRASEKRYQSKNVYDALANLHWMILLLKRVMVSQVSTRAASAVVCLLVMLLGAVLAIRLRGSLPLVVYMWSVLAAFIGTLIVRTGNNFCGDMTMSFNLGIFVTWVGNATLLAVIGAIYWRLRRT
ncbi:MAG: LptF/LptG family permease [Phycisphaera sp.]|nr:LptF/LptG family permease [Phycisphaera sp.]